MELREFGLRVTGFVCFMPHTPDHVGNFWSRSSRTVSVKIIRSDLFIKPDYIMQY